MNKFSKFALSFYIISIVLLLILVFTRGIPYGLIRYESPEFFVCTNTKITTYIYNGIICSILGILSILITIPKFNTIKFKYLFPLVIITLIFFIPYESSHNYPFSAYEPTYTNIFNFILNKKS